MNNSLEISNSSLENEFKIAQILQMQKRSDQAIKKYIHIINSYEAITKRDPNAFVDYSITALSIGNLVELYKSENELDKALDLLSIQKKFIEHMSALKPTHSKGNQNDTNQELNNPKEQNVISLFNDFNKIVKMPSNPPRKHPEEIINDFLKEKQKQDKKASEQNMLRLLQLVEEKKRRLENSKFERWSDWINNNPFAILIFAMIFLGLFLLFVFAQFKLDGKSNQKISSKNIDENSKNSQNSDFNADTPPKLTKEELKQLSEKLKKINDEKLRQKLDLHKEDYNSFLNQMKKRYQINKEKAEEL